MLWRRKRSASMRARCGSSPSLEHAAPAHQRGIERLALDQAHAALVQLIPVARVARARDDRQIGESARAPGPPARGSAPCRRSPPPAPWPCRRRPRAAGRAAWRRRSTRCQPKRRAPSTCSASWSSTVARMPLAKQQARHDLPVAAEAGDDDRGVLRFVDLLRHRLPTRCARRCAAAPAVDRQPAAAATPASTPSPRRPAASLGRLDHAGPAWLSGTPRSRTRRPAPAG